MLAFTADLLTFSRLIAAAILVWLGTRGPATLPTAVAVAVAAWTTDQLDGLAARHSSRPTHLAPYDFAIDSVLYAGTLTYLTLASFVPLIGALIFAAIWLVAIIAFHQKAIDVLCVRLIDLVSAIVIFRHLPLLGWAIVGWMVVLAVIYRRRLAKRVPHWFAQLAQFVGRRDEA